MQLLSYLRFLKTATRSSVAIYFGILILSTFLMSGCESTVSSGNSKHESFVFPVANGSWWHYEITMDAHIDTIGSRYYDDCCNFEDLELEYTRNDTVTLTITGIDTIDVNQKVAQVLKLSHRSMSPRSYPWQYTSAGATAGFISR